MNEIKKMILVINDCKQLSFCIHAFQNLHLFTKKSSFLLTDHPHNRDRASAAGTPQVATPSQSGSWWCHALWCPAGMQNHPKHNGDHPLDQLEGQGPSTWGNTHIVFKFLIIHWPQIITAVDGVWPIFDLIGPFHSINIHPDLKLHMRWDLGGPGVHVHEDEACPELWVFQQVQGLKSQRVLIRQSHKLIQVYTLRREQWERQTGVSAVHLNMSCLRKTHTELFLDFTDLLKDNKSSEPNLLRVLVKETLFLTDFTPNNSGQVKLWQ